MSRDFYFLQIASISASFFHNFAEQFEQIPLMIGTDNSISQFENSYLTLARLGKNQWWRYAISIVLILLFSQLLGILPMISYVHTSEGENLSYEQWVIAEENMDFEALGLSKNTGLALMLLSFAIGLGGLFIAVRFIHRKVFMHLINASKKLRWNRIWFAVIVWGGLLLIELITTLLLYGDQLKFQFDVTKFIPLVLISLLLLPVQTSFEELVYRGYYLQMFSLLSKYPIVPVTATSLMFAAMHMFNPEVAAFGWPVMFSYYFAFGFSLALITIWDRGLEIALGVHAINNVFTALAVTTEDSVLQVDALWITNTQTINWWTILIYFVFFSVLTYLYYWYFRKEAVVDSETIVA